MKGTEQHETFYKHKYERSVKKLKEFEVGRFSPKYNLEQKA